MKLKTLTAALLVGVSSTAAMAADLPSRKTAPAYAAPAPIFTWSGFYLGLQGGVAWDKVSTTGSNAYYYALLFPNTATLPAYGYNGSATKTGFVGGGHLGYNFQSGPAVFGLEGDLEGASVWSGSLRGSLRGRLGLAMDRVLLYATGGLAFANRSGSNSWGGYTSSSRLGWTAGAGVEYAFSQNWSAGLEYRYSDFGTNNSSNIWTGGSNVRLTENAVRARISYHFSAPAAPVVAKY